MIRSRAASATAVLMLAWAALVVPAALAQTPSPSPSPSTSGASPSAGTSSATAEPERESVAVLLSAEPDTIEAGHETVLVAQVTNTGTGAADAALDVVLPAELELVDAFPRPTSTSGATLSFALGPLAPGDSSVVQITARGIDVVPEAVVTATATAGSASASDSTGVAVVVTGAGPGGNGGLVVASSSRRVLTQVGSMMRYEVTVANDGAEDLENVLVVNVAPEEIDVISVDIVDEVEAVQIGDSGGRHDIVWNVGSLPAGASVVLPWDGRAARAGDLTAVNSVRGLLGQTETVRVTSRSYLAREGARDVANPPFDPIEKRVVTFVDPPASATPMATTAPSGTVALPVTGADVSRYAFAALLFVLSGVFLLGGARLASRGSARALVTAMLAGVLLAACVSGNDPGDGAAAPSTASTDDPRTDAEVKGERITRGDDEDERTPDPTSPPSTSPPNTTSAPATASPVAPPATAAPPVVAAPTTPPVAPDPEPVRVVEVVRVGLEDLPVETLASRDSDNTVSFSWDEAFGIVGATSGTRHVRGNDAELLTDLTTADGKITNQITLTSALEDERLRVQGRIVHEVYSGGRLVARLRSAPIDEVLAPRGSVVARFSYLVPTGDYTIEAAFESSH